MLDGVRNELHRYFGLPFYRTMFEAAGYGKDLAAYDAAAPDRDAQKLAISEEFIDSLCALATWPTCNAASRATGQPAPHTQ